MPFSMGETKSLRDVSLIQLAGKTVKVLAGVGQEKCVPIRTVSLLMFPFGQPAAVEFCCFTNILF